MVDSGVVAAGTEENNWRVSESNSATASSAPDRLNAWMGTAAAAASATAARIRTGGSRTNSGCASASSPAQYEPSRVRARRLTMIPASSGRPPRRCAIRSTLRTICATPSELQAAGSVTTTTRSAANSALTVSSPSDGGQSMITSSNSPDRPSRAVASRSCAPITSLTSWCSTCARAGELGITDGTTEPSSGAQPAGTTASAAEPARSSVSTVSMVRSASKMPSPVVALACGSRSTTSTDLRAAPNAEASPRATVVLPTPPF